MAARLRPGFFFGAIIGATFSAIIGIAIGAVIFDRTTITGNLIEDDSKISLEFGTYAPGTTAALNTSTTNPNITTNATEFRINEQPAQQRVALRLYIDTNTASTAGAFKIKITLTDTTDIFGFKDCTQCDGWTADSTPGIYTKEFDNPTETAGEYSGYRARTILDRLITVNDNEVKARPFNFAATTT